PVPNDPNNKWVSYLEASEIQNEDLQKIKNLLPYYAQSLEAAAEKNDYTMPNSLIEGLTNYQHKFGGKVMPSDKKIDAEILYNKYDIFKKLFEWYMYAGVLMLFFVIINIFYTKKWVKYTVNLFHAIIGLLFILHTLGLIARWYISGHAPWSNAYESVIYVGWATMFFGLAFGRKSRLTVASTAFVAAIVLWVAHQNWTDPEIGNLVPVLNSYWLMIHVAVIVGSYGPFTLGFVLGIVALFLMFFTNKDNKEKMELNIKEITYINEMALTVGLV